MTTMEPRPGHPWLVVRDGDSREHFIPRASVADVHFATTDEGGRTANIVTTAPSGQNPFTITVLGEEAEALYRRCCEQAGLGERPFPGPRQS